MQIIPLQSIPNQSFSVQLDNINFDLRLHDCGNIMAVDIIVNNVPLLSGIRAVNGFPIIPTRYLEAPVGNFMFANALDNDDEYPYWDRFGTDQILVYASPQELAGFNFKDYIQGILSAPTA